MKKTLITLLACGTVLAGKPEKPPAPVKQCEPPPVTDLVAFLPCGGDVRVQIVQAVLVWSDVKRDEAYVVTRQNLQTGEVEWLASLPANATTFADYTLSWGVAYRYWVHPVNRCGSGESNPADYIYIGCR